VCFPTLPPKIEEMTRPTRRELQWLELAMKVITPFSCQKLKHNHMLEHQIKPIIENNVTVQLLSGRTVINFSHWPSKEAWGEMENYLKGEDERGRALRCKVCQKVEDPSSSIVLKNCGGCKQKLYCSRECQTSDWNSHKLVCNKK